MITQVPCQFIIHPRQSLQYEGKRRYVACFAQLEWDSDFEMLYRNGVVIDDGTMTQLIRPYNYEHFRVSFQQWLQENQINADCFLLDFHYENQGMQHIQLYVMDKDLALHIAKAQAFPEGVEVRSWHGYYVYAA